MSQSHLTLCKPTDCSLPGSCVHGIIPAKTLEQVVISYSKGSSQPSVLWQADSLPLSHLGGPNSLLTVLIFTSCPPHTHPFRKTRSQVSVSKRNLFLTQFIPPSTNKQDFQARFPPALLSICNWTKKTLGSSFRSRKTKRLRKSGFKIYHYQPCNLGPGKQPFPRPFIFKMRKILFCFTILVIIQIIMKD